MTSPDNFALIMAGGFGKRLGRQTSKRPKALVEVGGKPLIEHVLTQIENVGPKHIFISVHYLGDMIEDYIEKTGRHANVSILRRKSPLVQPVRYRCFQKSIQETSSSQIAI